jgi:hypothetical protein
LVGLHASDVTLPLGDIILIQLAIPIFTPILTLVNVIKNCT